MNGTKIADTLVFYTFRNVYVCHVGVLKITVSMNFCYLQVTCIRNKVSNCKLLFVISKHDVVLVAVGVTATVAGIAIYRVYMARKQN